MKSGILSSDKTDGVKYMTTGWQLQIRIPHKLKEAVDQAVAEHNASVLVPLSRADWIISAIVEKLERKKDCTNV